MRPCPFSHEDLNSYVDGELAGAAENDLRRHLDLCPTCQATVKALLALKSTVAAAAKLRPVPHTLRERVGALVPPPWRPWAGRAGGALAVAASLLVVLGVIYYWSAYSG